MQIPENNCPICPRLAAFREENRVKLTAYWNAPVPSFGELDAQLLIIGLGPGLHGANQTGRPFTGDYAGFTLYHSLQLHGFAQGNYFATLPDTLDIRMSAAGDINGQGEFHLINCRISNAVRCVPQENKPENSEIKNCNQFLKSEIAAMPNLKAILSLGLVSHNAVLMALGLKPKAAKFSHGAVHQLGKATLYNSYHCSRYNINTKRLTQEMFDRVIADIAAAL
jgi:uracil-DNA glycosylase